MEKEDEVVKRGLMSGKVRVSQTFVTALAIVSIIGFAGIVSQSIFTFDLGNYIEALLMLIMGTALIIEAKIKQLKSLAHGLNPNNFSHLTTAIIGFIAVTSGVLSIPPIRLTNPAFLAIKGIISIIAIAAIIIENWIAK